MAVVIDGTTGISTPANTVLGNLSYTGTLTGNGGIVNLGSGQVYKDASGNVGVGTITPKTRLNGKILSVNGADSGVSYQAGIELLVNGASAGELWANSTDFVIGSFSTQPMIFRTQNTERARIDSSGNLLVGVTTSTSSGILQITASNVKYGLVSRASTTNSSAAGFFNLSGTEVGSINTTGSTTSYVTSSDYRLKEAIAPMTGALARVALLKPVTYKWKVDGSDGQGFIAHELAEVEAGCVTGEKDAVDADGNPKYQGIDTSFLVATLAAAIQEQQTIIEQQSAALTALTARITALEGTAA